MLDPLSAIEIELQERWPENKIEPTLDRISALLRSVGNPHRSTPVIHITGTNGKSTTARMIDELLRANGLRTGRYTSPHLESVRERIVIDGEIVNPRTFMEAYQTLRPHIDEVDATGPIPLSFFEIMTAIGFLCFSRTAVDVAVVEVGMGGRWDATNVVDGRICVITPISLDHTEYLGPDEVAIAGEKGGIVKFGSTLVMSPQLGTVAEVLTARARSVDATVVAADRAVEIVDRALHQNGQTFCLRAEYGDYPDIELSVLGQHQAENACTALCAVESFLAGTGGGPLDPAAVRRAFDKVTAPGRLETVATSPTTVIDVSHNPAGMQVSVNAFREAHPSPAVVVLAVLGDKDIEGVLRAVAPVAGRLIVSQNESPRCLPARDLHDCARRVLPHVRIDVEDNLGRAIARARSIARDAGPDVCVLVTGSVVTAGQARALSD